MRTHFFLVPALALGLSCGDDGGSGEGNTNAESGESNTPTTNAETSTGATMRDPCAESSETMADCVEQERYVADLETLASQPRFAGDPGHAAALDLGFERFTEFGYETVRQEFSTGTNIVGRRVGTTRPDEIVVIAAHFDSVPDCPGADDNASGSAGVIEAARVLAKFDFERTLVVALWDQEEINFGGVEAYVSEAVANGDNVVGNFNLEMIAYFDDNENSQTIPTGLDGVWPEQAADIESDGNRGNFITLVADENAREMSEALVFHADRIGLRSIWIELLADWVTSPLFADLRRSDHSIFWDAGYPAIMITDTSEFRYDPYHCRNGLTDEVANLDYARATQVVQMTVGAAADYLGGL